MTLARQMIRDIYQELVISVEIKPVFKLSNLEWADFAQNRTQFQVPEDGKRRFRILIALAQELSKIPSEDTKSQLEEIQMKTERLFWIALSRYRDLGWLELGIVLGLNLSIIKLIKACRNQIHVLQKKKRL